MCTENVHQTQWHFNKSLCLEHVIMSSTMSTYWLNTFGTVKAPHSQIICSQALIGVTGFDDEQIEIKMYLTALMLSDNNEIRYIQL